ncbi:MAG: hypothetical protein GDA55_02395 [Cellvibrionales bacterium]|nr:hypothetical protein [Cellvibrionales bacterium]
MKTLFIKIYLAIALLSNPSFSQAEEAFPLTGQDLELNVIVTRWALHHLDVWNTPFSKPNNHAAAVPYLPVLYVVRRHMTDVVLNWHIIEAHLLINYPELGIAWLAAYERDFELTLRLGRSLFFLPCEVAIDGKKSIALGHQVIESLQKYVNTPSTLPHKREIANQLLVAYLEVEPKKGGIKDVEKYCHCLYQTGPSESDRHCSDQTAQ